MNRPKPRLPLSPREKDMLAHLLRGRPYKVVADQALITESTVKVHAKAILRKYGFSSRAELMHAFAAWRAATAIEALKLVADGISNPNAIARVALEELGEFRP